MTNTIELPAYIRADEDPNGAYIATVEATTEQLAQGIQWEEQELKAGIVDLEKARISKGRIHLLREFLAKKVKKEGGWKN